MYSSEGATLSDWTGTCRYSAARFAVSAVIGQRGRGRSSSRTLHRRPSSIVYRACMRTKRSEADRRIGLRLSTRIARVGWPEASDSYARRRGFLPVRRCVFASQLASSDAPGLDRPRARGRGCGETTREACGLRVLAAAPSRPFAHFPRVCVLPFHSAASLLPEWNAAGIAIGRLPCVSDDRSAETNGDRGTCQNSASVPMPGLCGFVDHPLDPSSCKLERKGKGKQISDL